MDQQIVAGLFTLAGALLGGVITLATVRLDRRWGRAKKNIADLCQQVSAFYQLEQLYKEEVATLRANSDGSKPSAKTVMEEMRGRVQELEGQVRPTMTSRAADEIRRHWN